MGIELQAGFDKCDLQLSHRHGVHGLVNAAVHAPQWTQVATSVLREGHSLSFVPSLSLAANGLCIC
jgi:hypothetical protein